MIVFSQKQSRLHKNIATANPDFQFWFPLNLDFIGNTYRLKEKWSRSISQKSAYALFVNSGSVYFEKY